MTLSAVARFLYTLLFTLLLPVIVLRLWWRGRKNPGYRQRIGERFGRIPHRPQPGGLWLHAVSVGETLASAPLVKAFQQKHPNIPLIITTTTPTGSEQVRRLFGQQVYHMYLPYDLTWFMNRFIRSIRPGLLLVMETELWPNLLACCEEQKVPVVLANARLSEKSAAGYEKFAALTQPMLQRLSRVAAQHRNDGERFLALGLEESRLEITGSVKFDVSVPADCPQKGVELRNEWGNERRVLALASSHPEEDEQLLDLYPTLQQQFPDLVLLLIPRHPERFDPVVNAAHSRQLKVQRRSKGPATSDTQVYVADTMGEMLQLLAAADLVVMGGSLIPHGGHNPIEPAALGKATLTGPHYTNFAAIVDTLKEEGGMDIIPAVSQSKAVISRYLADSGLREAMGTRARATVEANKGAVARLLATCEDFLRL